MPRSSVLALSSLTLVAMLVAAGASKALTFDTTHATFQKLDPSKWEHRKGSDDLWIVGDPKVPGLCIQLVNWQPGNFSHPHYHTHARYATVLSGTWWVGTGDTFDTNNMQPMPTGTFVTDLANKVHYDGAKAETGPAIVEIVMDCPIISHSATPGGSPE
jgi:quercetin dioxygenase-like cupin family protein